MSVENGPKPGVDFEQTDLGDVTHSGAEIMYRMQQEALQRQQELLQMDDTFDDRPPINEYPNELNNRHG